jgi:protein-L-isoaspartate(D-aspartate) O-methyltransferase
MRRYLSTLSIVIAMLLSACGPTVLPPPPSTPGATGVDEFAEERERMVMDQIEGREIHDPAVLNAMRRVARHDFVPAEYLDQAYDDHPLPIGFGQTISQPYVVALMSEALHLKPGARVLEIGTGSGYQAAVLAEMGMQVYTIEIIRELADQATARLQALGYIEVHVRAADGYGGWPEEAPFDAIIVTAAPDHVPQPLLEQLKPGGRLVIPVGPIGAVQTLWQITIDQSGEVTAYNLGDVRFVPLTRSEQTP